eukprot:15469799-Alexandrium_andersonii.AAC.1
MEEPSTSGQAPKEMISTILPWSRRSSSHPGAWAGQGRYRCSAPQPMAIRASGTSSGGSPRSTATTRRPSAS